MRSTGSIHVDPRVDQKGWPRHRILLDRDSLFSLPATLEKSGFRIRVGFLSLGNPLGPNAWKWVTVVIKVPGGWGTKMVGVFF